MVRRRSSSGRGARVWERAAALAQRSDCDRREFMVSVLDEEFRRRRCRNASKGFVLVWKQSSIWRVDLGRNGQGDRFEDLSFSIEDRYMV